jgi:hypothetical protein
MKPTDSHRSQKKRLEALFRGGCGETALSRPNGAANILQRACMEMQRGWVKAGDLAGRILANPGSEGQNPAIRTAFFQSLTALFLF